MPGFLCLVVGYLGNGFRGVVRVVLGVIYKLPSNSFNLFYCGDLLAEKGSVLVVKVYISLYVYEK